MVERGKEIMEKYSWDFDGDAERWNNDSHDTVEECVEDAICAITAGEHNYAETPAVVYIGENREFIPRVDVTQILDALEEQAYDECGEIGGDWQTYDWKKKERDDVEELAEELNKVVIAWLTKYSRVPHFYTVENIKEYPLNLDAGSGRV